MTDPTRRLDAPGLACIDLTPLIASTMREMNPDEILEVHTDDPAARVVVSTYPTMANAVERSAADGGAAYGPDAFGLVVIDEAHRSVYDRYRVLFDYFDALYLGLTATPGFNLQELCEPHLLRLAEATEDIVFLTVRSGYDAICIDRKEGRVPIRSYTLVGTRRPLGIGAGSLAILCSLPKKEIENVLAVNAPRLSAFNDITVARLREMVAAAKQSGYALHDGSSGARAIGLPVRNAAGAPFAAISVSAIESRMGKRRCKKLGKLISSEVSVIERLLRNN
jgi:DNA-binding IclR family transcriptional regulator/TusA-related sulfurtransferase